jgi:hypothetical protein
MINSSNRSISQSIDREDSNATLWVLSIYLSINIYYVSMYLSLYLSMKVISLCACMQLQSFNHLNTINIR